MTISIFILLAVMAAVGFWFYYKKQKATVTDVPQTTEKSKEKRALNDIDKMLSHVSDNSSENDAESKNSLKDDTESESLNEKTETPDKRADIQEKILGSVILGKKKKK